MDYSTYYEIKSQTQAWKEAWENIEHKEHEIKALYASGFERAIFIGCGSTYYLSMAAASLFQRLSGLPAYAQPAGEFLLTREPFPSTSKTLLVAISRSGSTTETLLAVDMFRQRGIGKVLGITNYADQPLAGKCDLAIIIEKGQEKSIAQTRSFTSLYLAITAFIFMCTNSSDLFLRLKELPAIGERLMTTYEGLAQEYGERLDFERIYFLGSGMRYGLACEANLKMKEMTLTHSEAFHFLEFRHGPMSMVDEKTLLVGLLSEEGRSLEMQVLEDMAHVGASLLTLGEYSAQVNFRSQLPELVRGVLYLPILQLMAYYRAVAKGLDPDHPKNLTSVVKLDIQNKPV